MVDTLVVLRTLITPGVIPAKVGLAIDGFVIGGGAGAAGSPGPTIVAFLPPHLGLVGVDRGVALAVSALFLGVDPCPLVSL